ncbi:MAG: cyclic pyranopterin monophosphate synthase MoaC [bacterium]
MKKKQLPHVDNQGRAKMVEVTEKSDTKRQAIARGFIQLSKAVIDLIHAKKLPKGDPLETARIAGIMAAKKTHELIPLCHPLLLTNVEVDLQLTTDGIEIESKVVCVGKTGVEMEALTAVSVAALTIYDMCKAVDKHMRIGNVYLAQKSGGRSGTFENTEFHKKNQKR